MEINLKSMELVGRANRVPEEYFELKTIIHDRLLDLVDLSVLETLDRASLKSQIRLLVEKILREDITTMPLNSIETELLITEIQDEVMGLGPLEPLLQDPTVSDILVNTYRQSLYRTIRQAGADRCQVQGRPAPQEDH